ncbi:DNA-binding FadR family transcriptional regulator [Streptomyces sp. 846.5]|nr:FadR/GntR family transcriptional regulator [Streptomyces sp. 846.5]TDT97466.1 DNA-binding FadR family transcriptional regulator [Streptomyces sp. 846.5]
MSSYPGRGLHGQIVEQIGVRIVGGTYQPHATLFSEHLEQEFGVSKTVVREALKVIAAKGLVESRQKRGTVVLPRESWNLLDADVLRWQGGEPPNFVFLEKLAEVREMVEPPAARFAALRRTPEDLETMRAALDDMEAARRDPDAMVAADLRFHRALLDSAHNEVLSRMEVILAAGLQIRDRFVHHSAHGADPMPAHRALYEAIQDSDADRAGVTVQALLAQAASDLAEVREHADRVQKPRRRSPRTATTHKVP